MNKWNLCVGSKSRICTLFAFTSALAFANQVLAAANSSWVATKTMTHPIHNAVFREFLPPKEAINIIVALKLRNEDQLDQLVENLNNPSSPDYGKWRSHDQVHQDYAPTQEQAQAVVDYLSKAGFTNIEVAPNRLLISAVGSADIVRKGFNTEIARFVRDNREAIANTKDVQVPKEIADKVSAVIGLQTLDTLHPHIVAQTSVAPTATAGVRGINPIQFPVVYHALAAPVASKTTVGIITAGNMAQPISDLHTFESINGLPTINPIVVQVGSAGSDTSNTAEWDLDSQTIQGMSGGTVNGMILYTATSLSNPNIIAAFNKAETDNQAKVINVSLGECETSAKNDGSLATADNIFKLAVAQGQTFSVSTGDSGSQECGGASGESWPATSPNVIAVGGTTLSTDTNNNYISETAWSSGGGGSSVVESKPAWQASVVSGSYRGVPDIAFDGDPSSGAIIIVNGSNAQYGGTSLSSPIFVGLWARLQTASNNALGFPASTIYSRGNAYPSSVFHDVTSGSNGGYVATAGWDYTTGFGSLDAYGAGQQLFNLFKSSNFLQMMMPAITAKSK